MALMIVAIALAGGMKASGALTNNAQREANVTAAQWCADNELLTYKLGHQFPPVGDSDFSCDELGVSYRGHLPTKGCHEPRQAHRAPPPRHPRRSHGWG